MEKEKDLMVVFRNDGSIRVGWDATSEQLRAVRDKVIPALLGQNVVKVKMATSPDEFTVYTIPPTKE